MLEFPTSNHTCIYSIGLSNPLISCLHTCHWPLSFIIDIMDFSQAVSNSVCQWDITVGISGRVTILFFISIFSPDPLVSTAKPTCFFFHSFRPYGGLRNLQSSLPSPAHSHSFPLVTPSPNSWKFVMLPFTQVSYSESRRKEKVKKSYTGETSPFTTKIFALSFTVRMIK